MTKNPADVTVASFLETCRGAFGSTFEGYKGGEYVMGRDAVLWQARYGDCGRAIIGAEMQNDRFVLLTTEIDD